MGIDDGISTIQRSVKTIVYLFLFVIAFLPTYALAKPIRALAQGNTQLTAIMFIVMWLIFFFVGYIGTYRMMTTEENYNEIKFNWWKKEQ